MRLQNQLKKSQFDQDEKRKLLLIFIFETKKNLIRRLLTLYCSEKKFYEQKKAEILVRKDLKERYNSLNP